MSNQNLGLWGKYGRNTILVTTALAVLGIGYYEFHDSAAQRKIKNILQADKKQTEDVYGKRIVQLDSLNSEKAKQDSIRSAFVADSIKLAALEKARADSVTADSLREVTKGAIAQVQITTREVELEKIKRINDYIRTAQKINPKFKAGIDRSIVIFTYFTADTTGKANFSQRQRKLSINDKYFTTRDSLEENVARLTYIRNILNKVENKWYNEFVDQEFDECAQLSGRNARSRLGQDISNRVEGFNEDNEYVFRLDHGEFEGYRTVREGQTPNYTATQEKVKKQFKLEIKSDEARERAGKIGKSRRAFDDPKEGKLK